MVQSRKVKRVGSARAEGARRATGVRADAAAVGSGALAPGQRWSASRKRDVVLRLLRGESLDVVSREVGVELYRLETWKARALAGLELGLKDQVGVAGIGYATAGIWLCYDLARRLYPTVAAFWATLTLWLGGSLLYYSLVSPTYSHATSLFAIALFVHTWYRTRGRDDLGVCAAEKGCDNRRPSDDERT